MNNQNANESKTSATSAQATKNKFVYENAGECTGTSISLFYGQDFNTKAILNDRLVGSSKLGLNLKLFYRDSKDFEDGSSSAFFKIQQNSVDRDGNSVEFRILVNERLSLVVSDAYIEVNNQFHGNKPNVRGSITIDGVDYWMNGWSKVTKNDAPFLGITIGNIKEQKADKDTQAGTPKAPPPVIPNNN